MTAMDARQGNSFCYVVVAIATHNERPMSFWCIQMTFIPCFLVHWIIWIHADVIAAMHAWSGTSSCSSVMMISICNERPMGFLHILDFYRVLLIALTWLEMSWYHYCNICMKQKKSIFLLWRTSSYSSVMTIATCNEMPMGFLHILILIPRFLAH
jgi:hypothetical protein